MTSYVKFKKLLSVRLNYFKMMQPH